MWNESPPVQNQLPLTRRCSETANKIKAAYILQSMYKNETDPKCLLCAKEEENIEHFILNCKSLSKVRNTILQEIMTAFTKLGIEFDEQSASEKLQHILDITPVVKTKKLSPASVVEIERLTRRLLYQLHIARYKVICC